MGETKPRVFVMTGNGIEGCHDQILRETPIPYSEHILSEDDTDGTDDVYLAPISTIFSRKRSHSLPKDSPRGASDERLVLSRSAECWRSGAMASSTRKGVAIPHESQHGNQWKQWLAERFVCRVVVSHPEDMRLPSCARRLSWIF